MPSIPGRRKSDNAKQRGAAMVEIVLSLPLFLAALLFFIWFSVLLNARISFTSAVVSAGRLAITRGKPNLVRHVLIPEINQFHQDGNWTGVTTPNNLFSQGEADYQNIYNTWSNAKFGVNFSDLPLPFLYTFVYINEAMRISVGDTVRYPTDPTDPLAMGPGRMACEILNPCTRNSDPLALPTTTCDGRTVTVNTIADLPLNRITLHCKYEPSNFVLAPMIRLIRLVAGAAGESLIVFDRSATIDVNVFNH